MAEYLTPAWFAEVNAAAAATARSPEGTVDDAAVTVQQVVTGAPGGEVRYWVRVDEGGLRAGLGVADGADATVTEAYETAVAVTRGELGVETAFLAGRIRVEGDGAALLHHRQVLGQVLDALAAVHARTTYR